MHSERLGYVECTLPFTVAAALAWMENPAIRKQMIKSATERRKQYQRNRLQVPAFNCFIVPVKLPRDRYVPDAGLIKKSVVCGYNPLVRLLRD